MEFRQPPLEGLERLVMEQILVTGATGFIGSHLVERLIHDKYDVIILKRSTSDTWRIKDVLHQVKKYDLDKTGIETIFQNEAVGLIIHLATNYGRQGETIKDIIESNITFPSVLIDSALKKGLKGIVNIDTSAIDACSFYASTKKAFLHILNYFNKHNGVKIASLQLQYVYGPKDDDSKFIPRLIKSVIRAETIDASPGMQKRDFVFVEDVVDAFIRTIDFMEKIDKDFITLEIGSGKSISLRNFAAIVEDLASKKSWINWGSLAYRKNEIFDSKAHIEKTKELLDWCPKYTLNAGLRKTIDWYMRGKGNG